MVRLFPHRLAPAVVVALLSFAGITVAIGQADADAPTAPEVFGIASPHVGDIANYTIVPEEGWSYDDRTREGDTRWHAFGWQPAEEILDQDGMPRHTNTLLLQGWQYDAFGWKTVTYENGEMREEVTYWNPLGQRIHYDSDSRLEVAEAHQDDQEQAFNAIGGPVPLLHGQYRTSVEWTSYNGPATHCLAMSPLQGIQSEEERFTLSAACRIPGLGFTLPAGSVLESEGIQDIGDGQAVAFVLSHPDEGSWLRAWYVSASPYPVAVHLHIDDPWGVRTGELRLEGLVRGDVPLEGPAMPRLEPAPALQHAPLTRYGIQDVQDRPFPLQEAVDAVAADASLDLAAYLDDHPDAFVFHTMYFEIGHAAHRDLTWHFTLGEVGASDTWSGMVTRTALAAAPHIAIMETREETQIGPEEAPPSRPTVAPTLESMHARLQAFIGQDLPRDAMGWSLYWDENCACFAVVPLLLTWDQPVGVTQIMPTDLTVALGMFYDNGTARYHAAAGMEGGYDLTGQGGGETRAAFHPATSMVSPWDMLRPVEVAGAGLLALLAGALVWAWPALKGLPLFGLFSRVQPDQVLEHPKRQAIKQAVAAEPGIHFQELRRRTGLANGSAVHHVQTLVRTGHLHERKQGGYTAYFASAREARQASGRPAIRAGTAQAIARLLNQEPDLKGQEIAARLGVAPATVSYHLRRLREAGAA